MQRHMMSSPYLPLSDHLLIVGHGRSGTNMVLDLFDHQPNTLCRNEPNELHGTAFTGLGEPMFGTNAPEDFEMRWRDAVAATARRQGDRDRFSCDKTYFRDGWRRWLGHLVMSRRSLRRPFLPRVGGKIVQDWRCPRFYIDQVRLETALPVMKILLTPAWIIKSHQNSPAQKVIHVIRDPEGFIQSWWGRYVQTAPGGPERVFADNLPSLAPILAHFGASNEGFEAYSLRALVVSELWRWRYMNEILLDTLGPSTRYIHAPYRAVMADRMTWAETLYDFADLPLSSDTRQKVEGMRNTLFAGRPTNGLDTKLVRGGIVEVLENSLYKVQLDSPAP